VPQAGRFWPLQVQEIGLMPGPHPKPSHLRQRTNKKAGSAVLSAPAASKKAPTIPNPDDRTWHPLTLSAWTHAWSSPMASQWIETDIDALGRLAVLWDDFYKTPDGKLLAEVRLQEARFGLTPLDRSRLQWEVSRGEEAEQKRQPRRPQSPQRNDSPSAFLRLLK
jgi:hypothetical protein